ncbi:Bax inhibitor-1/YccA family protein [Streptomyces sp. H10-C2]|uniref:Bax inhibitor-1/YccA family protein n=1 Tax=unclassified Streptomyces TaxID=2593676 RepID=UPI0024B9DA85|nr:MULTISPECIES: Bax inhibitor-1/YccA family protein [unclassified Streptomyces]MDJ0341309.1 Bax inhibitor-1/YccA family protein [Streptomyces sp. PH10-H1]MDJ0370904.1 Bax inhibitor-1/YccA family protein [Streptomyces sp. H10-C2]
MRSSNPVFSRRGFSRGDGYAGFGTQQQGATPQGTGNPYAQQGGNPYAQGGNPYATADQQQLSPEQLQQMYQAPPAGPLQTGRMTMDDVVMRTGMTLGTVIVGALVAWFALPVTRTSYGIAIGAALVAFVLAMIQAFKRTPVPALILGYAAFEGVFLGVISKMYNDMWSGAPVQAVLGTMAVFVGILIAYKTRLIRVTERYQRIGIAIAIGFVLLMVVNMLFVAFGAAPGGGLRSSGPLGIIVGIIGVCLGAFFLSLDFKQIEDGVRYGAPQNESWLAAFGLTLSLVWIYLEMLRLISILRD